jgi:hypothetical protein
MKSLNNIVPAIAVVVCMAILSSCKKDSGDDGPDVIFTTATNAYTVQFTNKTVGGATYKWDFGDGATSTEESPAHTYPGKGKYVPTLYVTTAGGKTNEGSTVIRIAKSSSIKLNDNSLADWDTVAYNVKVSGSAGGIFRKGKLDYDAENIYFYFEMASAVANGDIFDFYIDADNNSTTGLTTWVSTGTGNDVLLEGAMLKNDFAMFYHTGGQTSFTFDPQTSTDFYAVGTVQESGGIVKFEGKLVRSKIKSLTGKGMKLAVTATKSDWSATIGIIPDPGTPAFYLNMED